jgi:hypothetical protein
MGLSGSNGTRNGAAKSQAILVAITAPKNRKSPRGMSRAEAIIKARGTKDHFK